jgi:hypothetical protein
MFPKKRAKERRKALPNHRLGAYAKTIGEGLRDKVVTSPSIYI